MPFDPLRVVKPGAADQAMAPALDANGVPIWQDGDTNVDVLPAFGIGSCQGPFGNRRYFGGIRASLYLTDARAVVVARDYAKAGHVSDGSLVSAAIRNAARDARARREAAGTFLVGQMRHPWVRTVVYSRREGRRGDNTIRICGSHRTVFGDTESVMLIVALAPPVDPFEVAARVAERVLRDRYHWTTTTSEEREELAGAAFAPPTADSLPLIRLAGSYIVSAGSGRQGSSSSLSYRAVDDSGRQPEPASARRQL